MTEAKTDSAFPLNQFAIQGHSKPYGFGRNRNGGGVFIYVWEDVPNRELKIQNTPEEIESIFIVNLIKVKRLFCGCYHPHSQSDQYFFEDTGKTLDKYSKYYEINLFLLVISTLKNQNHAYHNSFTITMPRTLSRKTLLLKVHWILTVLIFL